MPEDPKTPRKPRRKAADSTPPATMGEATEVDSATGEPVAQPYAGVFVLRELSADGSVETKVVPQGDVRFSEVETILGLGLKGWRQQIGV